MTNAPEGAEGNEGKLVPEDTVPIVTDGHKAFRAGSYDISTGRLKQGMSVLCLSSKLV